MERTDLDDITEITTKDTLNKHIELQTRAKVNAAAESKVSALFDESESFPVVDDDFDLDELLNNLDDDLGLDADESFETSKSDNSLDVNFVKRSSTRQNRLKRNGLEETGETFTTIRLSPRRTFKPITLDSPETQKASAATVRPKRENVPVKEAVKPETKPEVKASVKPMAEPVVKPEAKPVVKPEAKASVKPVAKPNVKRKPEPEGAQAKAVKKPENVEPNTEKTEPKQKKNSARKIILLIIIIISACGLLFSGYKLFTIFHGYKESADTYKDIESVIKPVAPDPEKPEVEVAPFTVDMAALKEMNSDAQGYLYCKDLLSYPVVQCADNDYYLSHLFNGEWNSCGCLFIDYNLPEGFESRNCIIYGHNMNDGSMFASLYKYDDEEFYKQHKEFDVFVEGHHYIYKVFSLFVTPVDGFVYSYDFASDADFVNFLYTAAGFSPYETDYGELTADRKVITMSTCLGNNDESQRFVVMLIRDREVTD